MEATATISNISTGLQAYAARLKVEFKHAAKCLSDFRKWGMTASIYELKGLSIGEYHNLRTLLDNARRDGLGVGNLLSEIEKRRERHTAEYRRLKDADMRDAETGQATQKEKAIEDALIDFIDYVHEELAATRSDAANWMTANWNAPQGAQVASQTMMQSKKPDMKIPMRDDAVELYKAGMDWLARPCNQDKSAHDAVHWLVTKSQQCRKFRVRIRTKGKSPLDAETAGFVADTVEWKWDDPAVVAWGRHLNRYMKWRRDEEARSIAANQLVEPLPSPPLQIENKSPIRNKKPLKRVGKCRGK